MLRLVGAGVGRTGTLSLKLALEKLLGAPCYHMMEVFPRPAHVEAWRAAAAGRTTDWHELFRGYAATVDWPGASFWPELTQTFPDAIVLLSTRDAESWWRSAHATIFSVNPPEPMGSMLRAVFARFTASALDDRDACIAAYERHNAAVRKAVPAERLVEWTASDGWAPLCRALSLPVPAEPFPHANSTEEFQARLVTLRR